MRKIETVKQLNALIGQTYMFSIVTAIIVLALAFLIAQSIAFEGGRAPRDHFKRRLWFIILGILATIGFFLYNSLYTASFIKRASLFSSFTVHNIIATVTLLSVYTALGIILMFVFRSSKWGTILGKSKK